MGKASRLFNGQAEQTLYGRVTPSPEQRKFLQQQWNALADHLRAGLAQHGYSIRTWLQGSYKYGTLIKPVRLGEEYDVDLGLYFEWEAEEGQIEPSPSQLREWVQRELLLYQAQHPELKEVSQPPKERCSRAIYAQQFHIDAPTYHLDPDTDRRRLATLSGKWENSDPKALYKWFRDVVTESDREQLRRLIRYLKGWAAIAFDGAEAARPSSILLTVVVSQIFRSMWFERLGGMDDDDALAAIVKAMHAQLCESRDVWNPVDQKEVLNRIDKEAWPAFMSRLTALKDCAENAQAAEDEFAAAVAWSEAFGFLMPFPESDEIEITDASSNTAVMQIPDVQIEIGEDWDFKKAIATHRNEVPSVAKGHVLRFTIVNPQIVPAMAQVEWTVRNDGAEAVALGDLGHTRGGIGMHQVEERAAYAGKQYMDMVIRCNGSVYAARRLAVYIEDAKQTAKSRATPRAWMKLRSRKARRR